MKFLKPFRNAQEGNITQGFHNLHRALDWLPSRKLGAYGTPLVAPEDVTIGKVYGNAYTPDDNAPVKNGFGMWMKGVSGFEHLYWHTQPVFPVKTGDFVKRGTIVAYVGNSGNVFQGGEYVPLEKRNIPNFAGTHLHQALVRNGVAFDPTDYLEFPLEPNYSKLDELKAATITFAKILNLLKS